MTYLFRSPVEFSQYIETQAVKRDLSLLDMLKVVIEETGIEYEQVKPLLSSSLKSKIKEEFIELGYLPKEKSSISDFFGED